MLLRCGIRLTHLCSLVNAVLCLDAVFAEMPDFLVYRFASELLNPRLATHLSPFQTPERTSNTLIPAASQRSP